MTLNQVRKLLESMRKDDFRKALEAAPVKTLATLGIPFRDNDVPTPIKLPSDKQIQDLLDHLDDFDIQCAGCVTHLISMGQNH